MKRVYHPLCIVFFCTVYNILLSNFAYGDRIAVFDRLGLLRAFRESAESSEFTVQISLCSENDKDIQKLSLTPSSGLSLLKFEADRGKGIATFSNIPNGNWGLQHSKRWDDCIGRIEILGEE